MLGLVLVVGDDLGSSAASLPASGPSLWRLVKVSVFSMVFLTMPLEVHVPGFLEELAPVEAVWHALVAAWAADRCSAKIFSACALQYSSMVGMFKYKSL